MEPLHCVPRAPVGEVSSRVYLFAHRLNPHNNAFYPISSTQFICRIAAMTKPGEMHCVLWIQTIAEQVKTRRNLAHWGSWDTVR